MLLRSSSTPLLRSLLSDSPIRVSHHETNSVSSPFHSNLNTKLSFHQPALNHLNTVSCNSSPVCPSVSEFSDHRCKYSRGRFRRAQSEGNLEILAYLSEEDNEDFEEEEDDDEFGPVRRITSREILKMGLEKEKDLIDGGDCRGGGGGGGEFSSANGDQDSHGVEYYYKKMVEENPGNPIFYRNYAQFLYQTKGNLQGAEEYYSRAILVDPNDGEVLSQYAKLVWELHRDQERASSYFERAVQASSHDSHVHAAYASFLWETEELENEEKEEEEKEGCLGEELVNTPMKYHFNHIGSLRA